MTPRLIRGGHRRYGNCPCPARQGAGWASYDHDHRFNAFFLEAFPNQSLFQTYPKCISRHAWITQLIKKTLRKKNLRAITVLEKEGGGSGEVWSWSQIQWFFFKPSLSYQFRAISIFWSTYSIQGTKEKKNLFTFLWTKVVGKIGNQAWY